MRFSTSKIFWPASTTMIDGAGWRSASFSAQRGRDAAADDQNVRFVALRHFQNQNSEGGSSARQSAARLPADRRAVAEVVGGAALKVERHQVFDQVSARTSEKPLSLYTPKAVLDDRAADSERRRGECRLRPAERRGCLSIDEGDQHRYRLAGDGPVRRSRKP